MRPTTIIQIQIELLAVETVRNVLLVCAILSSLLYVGAEVCRGGNL